MPTLIIIMLLENSCKIITVVKPPRATPIIFCTSATMLMTTETISMTAPRKVTICIGAVEKEVIFRRAYFVSAAVDHLDSPAVRSCTSKVTDVVLKPIQEDIARKKAFFSCIRTSTSTAFRSSSLKSDALDILNPVAAPIRE